MRTYVSPIGYDTRRVIRPVVNTGLSPEDSVQLLRPSEGSDEERATQAIADVEQLLQEIEPTATVEITQVSTDSFEETVLGCCELLADIPEEGQSIVSLGGGARDILLPLTIASLVFAREIDTALFFSDLDSSVREWSLPTLTAHVPERAAETFRELVAADEWVSLSSLATDTDQSKSTIVRHVNALEETGVVETESTGKAKRARVSFSGELCWLAP